MSKKKSVYTYAEMQKMQAFKLKRKLWEQRYPWMELRVIGGGK